MAAQRGKDILLKIEGEPGVFTTVAGLRARTLSLNARTVDATDGDSAGRWRELLDGAGVKSAAVYSVCDIFGTIVIAPVPQNKSV